MAGRFSFDMIARDKAQDDPAPGQHRGSGSRSCASLVTRTYSTVPKLSAPSTLRRLRCSRFVGRKGYGAKALVGACLVKYLYASADAEHVADLIADHEGLTRVLGARASSRRR